MSNTVTRQRSRLWYLAPILGIWMGGLLAFLLLRKDDPPLARNCLILGIAWTGFGFVLNLIVFGI